jgi:hypothetical protein
LDAHAFDEPTRWSVAKNLEGMLRGEENALATHRDLSTPTER